MNNPYGLSPHQPPQPQPGYASAPQGHAPQPGYAPAPSYAPQGHAPPPGYAPQGHAPQPGYGQPGYGQAGYGQPGYGQPQGHVSYGEGVPPPYQGVPQGGGYQPNELSKLEDESQLWLIVAAVGFWVGFGWITGPLSWFFGSQLRGKYRALGHHPSSSANWAYGLGIASTMLYSLVVLGVFVAIAAVGTALSAGGI